MTAIANGHQPVDFEKLAAELEEHEDDVQDDMRDIVTSLRMLIAKEDKTRDKLASLLEASKTREKRARKALADLTGETSAAKPGPKPKGDVRSAPDWTPSEERIEAVRAAFFKHFDSEGTPITGTEIGRKMKDAGDGVASETIAKSVAILRDREVLRLHSTTRGGGKLWAPMRGADGS